MESLIIGNRLIKPDAADSTNSYAQRLLREQKPHEGTVIWTLTQTEGRGQRATKWHTSPGESLTFSVILTPTFLASHAQFLLNQAISCAINAYLLGSGFPEARIKWPNDIYIGQKKAGGILIENSLQGKFLQWSIIGIGINMNVLNFPEEIPNPVSLAQVSGKTYDLEAELRKILYYLDAWYLKLRNGKTEEINRQYFLQLLGFNNWQFYQAAEGNIFRGKIVGTENSGKLRIMMEDETIQAFDLKEVQWLPGQE